MDKRAWDTKSGRPMQGNGPASGQARENARGNGGWSRAERLSSPLTSHPEGVMASDFSLAGLLIP